MEYLKKFESFSDHELDMILNIARDECFTVEEFVQNKPHL